MFQLSSIDIFDVEYSSERQTATSAPITIVEEEKGTSTVSEMFFFQKLIPLFWHIMFFFKFLNIEPYQENT